MKDLRNTLKQRLLVAGAVLVLVPGPIALAQEPTATVHGHVVNAAGDPVIKGQVKFTKDVGAPVADEKFTNTVELDGNGNYTASGIAPGQYFIYVSQEGKMVDRMQVTIKASDNATVDFDMTRPEYLASMTPEARKAIEEYKAKNAAARSNNKVIANLNATMTSVRADLKSGSPNFDKDVTDSKTAVDAKPDEPLLWNLYGDALSARAKHAVAQDRTNKVDPKNDDAVKQSYTDAIDAYKKAADLLGAPGRKPTPEVEASVYNNLGTTYANTGNTTDAMAAFDKAGTVQPQNKAMFYGNEAAVLFNVHQDDAALVAAQKAIDADPTKPLPYFIKGQELLAKSTLDKAGKVVPPPGCVDAYQKYLELDPDSAQAADVRVTLQSLGEKVNTHYSAAKKK